LTTSDSGFDSGFDSVFGAEPDGAWAAPGRVNLIGEHTDYNDGFVLPFALPFRAITTARRRESPHWTVHSTNRAETIGFGVPELAPGTVTGWAAYVAGVVWALREAGLASGFEVPGADLLVSSDVPVGAGLSSSAALECSVVAALADLGGFGDSLDGFERARIARQAENDYVGVPCGIMDQAASTLCGEGHALFLDCRTSATEHVPLGLTDAKLAILVTDTKAPHELTDGAYADRLRACQEAAARLGVPALRDVGEHELAKALDTLGDEVLRRRVRHVVTEDARVLRTVEALRRGDLRGIGPLLTASHSSMRDDYEITVPEVDTAVRAALAAGAYGSRMTGGGFGGCVISLVDVDRATGVRENIETAFRSADFAPPASFLALPAAGAHRLS
jgi:galactokinase